MKTNIINCWQVTFLQTTDMFTSYSSREIFRVQKPSQHRNTPREVTEELKCSKNNYSHVAIQKQKWLSISKQYAMIVSCSSLHIQSTESNANALRHEQSGRQTLQKAFRKGQTSAEMFPCNLKLDYKKMLLQHTHTVHLFCSHPPHSCNILTVLL